MPDREVELLSVYRITYGSNQPAEAITAGSYERGEEWLSFLDDA